jgi:predicted RNase H-like HicB family nuclease
MYEESGIWVVEIPELQVYTQGKSIKNALEMARDAVGILLEDHTKGRVTEQDVKVAPTGAVMFEILCSDKTALRSLIATRSVKHQN